MQYDDEIRQCEPLLKSNVEDGISALRTAWRRASKAMKSMSSAHQQTLTFSVSKICNIAANGIDDQTDRESVSTLKNLSEAVGNEKVARACHRILVI